MFHFDRQEAGRSNRVGWTDFTGHHPSRSDEERGMTSPVGHSCAIAVSDQGGRDGGRRSRAGLPIGQGVMPWLLVHAGEGGETEFADPNRPWLISAV